jgi:hypothetical protein
VPAGGWLRTGDLARAARARPVHHRPAEGPDHRRRRNVYPHDVEFSVEHAHDAIALHKLAAFSVPTPDGEGVVVVAEQYPAAADAGPAWRDRRRAARRRCPSSTASACTTSCSSRRHDPVDVERQDRPPGHPDGVRRRHPHRVEPA